MKKLLDGRRRTSRERIIGRFIWGGGLKMGLERSQDCVGAQSESWKVTRITFLDRTTRTREKVTRVHARR